MGKKSRRKRERKVANRQPPAPIGTTWVDQKGVHAIIEGEDLSAEELSELTRSYQQSIRESPIWDEMVRQFGKQRAEELLSQCKAKLN